MTPRATGPGACLIKILVAILLGIGLFAGLAHAQDDPGTTSGRPEGRKPHAASSSAAPSPERQRALATTLAKRRSRRLRLRGNAYSQRLAMAPFMSQMMAQAQQMAAAAI